MLNLRLLSSKANALNISIKRHLSLRAQLILGYENPEILYIEAEIYQI